MKIDQSRRTGPEHICGMHCDGQDHGYCSMRDKPDNIQELEREVKQRVLLAVKDLLDL